MAGKSLKSYCFKNVKFYTNKRSMDDHNNFHEFVRVLYASTGTQSAEKCATLLSDTSCLQIVKFLYYPPNCTNMMPSTRTGYDQMLRRISTSVFTHL
jgi:hypothetical protein